MKKINLLIIAVTALFSCNTKSDTSKGNYSSSDINAELEKTRDSVTYYKTTQVDSVVNTLLKNDSLGVALGRSSENAPYLITVRTKPGFAEIHEDMDDIAIIRSGHGILKTGYVVAGNIRTTGEERQRNWLCDSIVNGRVQSLSPGDFIIIPAMTAHQYITDGGDKLIYWTIKAKRAKISN